jgi:inosine triphosphate pyrophosphatase
MRVTFVTGNQHKAELLAKFLGYPMEHQKVDLDEIQSLDLREIVEHKVRQAYAVVKGPVLVEDISLSFRGMGKLPGPFIKWFEQELGLEKICRMLDSYTDRSAIAAVTFAYYDGTHLKLFEGRAEGTITESVRPGDNSFGWNSIFVPAGSTKAYVEMTDEEQEKFGLRTTTVYPQIREFLRELGRIK